MAEEGNGADLNDNKKRMVLVVPDVAFKPINPFCIAIDTMYIF